MSDRIKPTGFTRLLRAFGYSFQGFRHTWREEAAFRQEVALSLLVIPAGVYLGESGVELPENRVVRPGFAWGPWLRELGEP